MIRSHWTFRVALAVILVLLAAPIFGAGRSEKAAATDEQITLRFSWWGGETRHNAYQDMLDLFMERNPNIRVEAEFSGWDGYIDRLRTQMAANNQPDVFVAGHDGPWQVLPLGARADIRDFDIDLSAFNDVQLDEITSYDPAGRLTGIPVSESVRAGYLINATLFDELGIELPKSDWTWEEMAEIAQLVYDRSGGTVHGVLDESAGISYGSFGRRSWDLAAHGAAISGPDGLTQTAEQLRDTYRWWGALRDSGAATSAEISVQADDGANSPIVTRDAAMMSTALGSYSRFQANTPDDLKMIAPPDGRYPSDEIGAGISTQISSQSRHPQAAAALVSFLRNDLDAGLIFGTENGIPANRHFREALIEQGLDAGSQVQFDVHNWVVANREVVSFVGPHEAHSEFSSLQRAEEQALAFGRQSIERTVEKIIEHARNLGM